MIFLSLGSNQGNRLNNLRNAIELLKSVVSDIKCSIVLETKAILRDECCCEEWDKPYLNMIISCNTTLSPQDLLSAIKNIEKSLGREDDYAKWSPRPMDIDILLYQNQIINTPDIKIPHLELLNRPFFVHLLATMNPTLRHPITNTTFSEIAHLNNYSNSCFIKSLCLYPKLVGVVNVTPDSFSDGGLYHNHSRAITQTIKLDTDGAYIIELGAQSTRPNANVSHDNELERLEPILKGMKEHIKTHDIKISIDSFRPETILRLISKYKIDWINDVTGALDANTLKIIASNSIKIVIMHSVTVPPKNSACIDPNTNPIEYINNWAEGTVERLIKCGFSTSDIILDPGIGFGKTSYQNIALLRHAYELKKFGCEILIGHSRKSYINSFYRSEPIARDLETIAASDVLYNKHIDYLRVHNVVDHQRFFVARQILS